MQVPSRKGKHSSSVSSQELGVPPLHPVTLGEALSCRSDQTDETSKVSGRVSWRGGRGEAWPLGCAVGRDSAALWRVLKASEQCDAIAGVWEVTRSGVHS